MMNKYLLLAQPEEEFPEQFNSYVFLIMEIIAIAKKLGRIFVLPYIHSHPRNTVLCEAGEIEHSKMIYGKINYPMEYFFDIEKIRQYVEIISFDEFTKISNKKISTLCCFGQRYDKTIDIGGKTFEVDQSIKVDNIDTLSTLDSSVVAISGYQRGKFLVRNSPNWHDDPTQDYWEIRRHLPYNQKLINIANNFIKSELTERYMAVHWRRGDRNHPEMSKVRELTITKEKEMKHMLQYYLIKPIKKLMRKHNMDKVFFATNCGTEWHMNYLKKYLPIIQYPTANSWKTMEFDGVIEQIICSKSTYYFSSPYNYRRCSSFSRWVIDSRILMGNKKMLSYQEKMGPIKVNFILFFIKRIRSGLIRRVGTINRIKNNIIANKTSNHKYIDGILFDNQRVMIDPLSAKVGGSWNIDPSGEKATAWDNEFIKIFFDLSKKYRNPIIFDIGSNTGSFALLASLNPDFTIYAFEPQKDIYDLLERNIKINHLEKQIKPFRLALSNTNGKTTLNIPMTDGLSGLATLGKPLRFGKAKFVEIIQKKLDDFASENSINHVDLIKIDTEGAELLVLKGGADFIIKNMPTMLIEYNPKNTEQFGYDSKEILHLLFSWGYNVKFISQEEIICQKK